LQPASNFQTLTGSLLFFASSSFVWLFPILHFVCALMLMLLVGNPMIRWLRAKRWKKGTTLDETWTVREDTPDTHQVKQGTPSMGGIGIIGAAVLTLCALIFFFVALAGATSSLMPVVQVWNVKQIACGLLLLPIVTLCHGALGFADDWSKASGRGGLRARAKLFFQFLLAFAFVALLVVLSQTQSMTGVRYLFFGLRDLDGVLLILALGFLALVVIAMGNAVNLTDGIDGLAAGLALQCGLALMLCMENSYEIGQLSILFWAALAGACLGFLNFNKYKARVFMGDTGSLAIGAALGAGAILQHAVFLLPFIGFIYFLEAASVTIQVLWFKFTKRKFGEGKRLFRRAPLHHHFELSGWSEWRVVLVFWVVNLFTSAIGLLLWHTDVLPRWP
jgi:phospho-N-acetylmuramoyl-pentapeptide-transferase